MAKKKKKSAFAGKVRANATKVKKQGTQYGYLNLPKGINIYSPEPGSREKFDILPYTVTDPKHPDRDDELGIAQVGDLWYKRPFRIHRNIGSGNDSVVCLSSIGKKCPICEYRAQRIRDGAPKDETDALKTSLRNLYVVVPIGHKKYDPEPHIMDISQFCFQDLLTDELEEDEQYETFPDLEEGWTIKVRWDSSTIGKSKPFAEASRIDFVPRKEIYDEDILEEVPNLDEVLSILSYKQLEAKFLEMEDDEEEETKTVQDESEDEEIPFVDDEADEENDTEDEKETDGEDEEEKEAERKKKLINKRKAKKKAKKQKDKCPHGYVFGQDAFEYDECDDCPLGDDCLDAEA